MQCLGGPGSVALWEHPTEADFCCFFFIFKGSCTAVYVTEIDADTSAAPAHTISRADMSLVRSASPTFTAATARFCAIHRLHRLVPRSHRDEGLHSHMKYAL